MKVLFRLAAEAELAGAWDHYASIDPALAADFLAKVDDALARLVEQPRAHAVVHRDLRRVPLNRFPHLLIYRLVGDTVVVVAFTHPRQDTSRWQRRR